MRSKSQESLIQTCPIWSATQWAILGLKSQAVVESHYVLWDFGLKYRIEGRDAWKGSKGEKRWLEK